MPQQTDLDHSNVSAAEAQTELDNLLRSPAFERSERLQRFLRFICELTLKGESHRINEYLIGSEVFQRGPEYSPNEDSIVRRQALTLRQKLQEYYAAEGRDHAVRIELPVGRYVPVFRRIERVTAPVNPESPALEKSRKIGYWPVLSGGLLLLAGLAIGMLIPEQQRQDGQVLGAATREIWGDWLQPGSEAVICFSNPMTTVIKHFDKPLPPDALPKRLGTHSDEDQLFRKVFRVPPGGYFYQTPVVNQTKMGEAISGVHLSALLTKAGVSLRSAQSRFLSWDELRNDNYILLGHNEANPWLELILKDYPFRLVATSGARPRGIVNVNPRPGEPGEYRISYSQGENDMDQEYALLSMIPGISRSRRMILINGLNAQATQAAAEFLTNELALNELLSGLRKAAPDHKGPWHFQAIVKTEVYDKVPTRATFVVLRVL
jgi:hypothetical protein